MTDSSPSVTVNLTTADRRASPDEEGSKVACKPVAYIMSRFPKLSETFVLNEILELERQGQPVSIFPLIRHRENVVHPSASRLIPRVRYTSFASPAVVGENLRSAVARPKRYFGALLQMVRETWREPEVLAKSLVLFPQSVLMARLIERQGIEHVHAHFATHPAQVALNVHRLTGIGYSFTPHAHDIFVRAYRRTLCPKVEAARFVVIISEFNRRFLWEVCPASRQRRLELVRYGVDLDRFRPGPGRLAQGGLRLLCVGRLTPYKGMEYLIRAISSVRERIDRDLRCQIVGEGDDRERLEQLVASCSVGDVVEFLGAQPQERVVELMADADLFVLASYVREDGETEGIPLTLIEAIACGVPVVTTRVSGIPELVEDGVNGLLVPPRDAEALAQAIIRLVEDAELRQALGRQGRSKVAAEYDLVQNVAKLRGLFAGLSESRSIGSSSSPSR